MKSFDANDMKSIDVCELAEPWQPEGQKANTLTKDITHTTTSTGRLFADWREHPNALAQLSQLPTAGQSLHGIIGATYALWEFVPSIAKRLAPAVIDELTISTLSMSQANATDMIDLLDNGTIKRLNLLVSVFWKAESDARHGTYDVIKAAMEQRNQAMNCVRTHCKILCLRMSSGERYIVESSANLRSGKCIEQFVMTHDTALYNWHYEWLTRLIGEGTK